MLLGIAGHGSSLEGDGVQTDVGQILLVVITGSSNTAVIGNPENEVGHGPVFGTVFA